MKVWKRALAAVLAVGSLVCLASCGTTAKTEESSSIQQVAGIAPDTVLFTVDGQNVTADDYCYWLTYNIDYVSNYIYGGVEPGWDEAAGTDSTVSEYIKASAMETAKTYRVLANKVTEYGCTLSEEDEAQLDDQFAEMISTYGENAWNEALTSGEVSEDMSEEEKTQWMEEHGQEDYNKALLAQTVSTESLRNIAGIYLLYSTTLPETLFAEDGPYAVSDEDFQAWLDENQYYSFKHILFSTLDDSGNAMDDEAKALVKATAQSVLDQINAADDPIAAFDNMMVQYTEDPGLTSYPDGYNAVPGDMLESVETAALALEVGGISELVESDVGYHIILRQSADNEETRLACENAKYNELFAQWLEEAQVEETEAYANLDLPTYYANLTALRTELYPEDYVTETTAPTETAAPSETTEPSETAAPTETSGEP